MKLITRDTDYAIRALCHIAKSENKIVSVKELVKYLRIPMPFLRKILQKLNKKSLLKSYKGKGGGFKLSKVSNKISITDLMRIFQGPVKLNEHIFKKSLCPRIRTCALKTKLDGIENIVIRELEAITISSLVKDH